MRDIMPAEKKQKRGFRQYWRVTVAALGAAMGLFATHATAKTYIADGADADAATADLNRSQLDGQMAANAIAIAKPASAIVSDTANSTVADASAPMVDAVQAAPSISSMGQLSDADVARIAGAFRPGWDITKNPGQLKNLKMIIIALNTAYEAMKPNFKGALRYEDKNYVIAEQIAVAFKESNFDPKAYAHGRFSADYMADRPADAFQQAALNLPPIITTYAPGLQLTDAQRQLAVDPLVNAVQQIAARHAGAMRIDVDDVLSSRKMLRTAYSKAPVTLKNIVRNSRMDQRPVEGLGGQTTAGILTSAIIQLGLRDEVASNPGHMSKAGWAYASHAYSPDCAKVVFASRKLNRKCRAQIRNNPSVSKASFINQMFASLGDVKTVVAEVTDNMRGAVVDRPVDIVAGIGKDFTGKTFGFGPVRLDVPQLPSLPLLAPTVQ